MTFFLLSDLVFEFLVQVMSATSIRPFHELEFGILPQAILKSF